MVERSCSLVIRCYNEEKLIGRLLHGIMQQTLRNVQIIIVDSGSTDATLSIASQYPAKILSIKPGDFSFGRSLNVGCASASNPFIVIASAHVYPVYNTWLESLLDPFSQKQIALVYGKQRGDETTRYSERQVFEKWFPDQSNLDQQHPFCNNANAALRRELWENMPYDETLTGLEDLDWAQRAIQSGYRLAYRADAEVVHIHNETPLRIYNRYRREAIAFKRIFPNERFHFGSFLTLLTRNILSDYYHACHDQCFRKNVLLIPLFRLMQFWGTYRGSGQSRPLDKRLRLTFYYPRGLNRSTPHLLNTSNGRPIDYAGENCEEEIVG
jgi:rhamnosyltransferase